MCGDLDEGDRFEGDLYQRFLVHAQALQQRAKGSGEGLNGYLDTLFADVLKRCVSDAESVAPADSYRHLAMQSLVLARLAGFLAGHVALNEDPLRKLMEATMHGYTEADVTPVRDHHEHDHHHGHDHGHDHDHGHAGHTHGDTRHGH